MGKTEEVMISEAAARFGLSRATLLYYDRIGVCKPSARNRSGYRFYREDDLSRLSVIVELRRAGIPLNRVAAALRKGGTTLAGILLARLGEINLAVEDLMARQERALVFLARVAREAALGPDDLEAVLAEAGIEERKRIPWHDRFRAVSPGTHAKLLAFLRERAAGRSEELGRLLSGGTGAAEGLDAP